MKSYVIGFYRRLSVPPSQAAPIAVVMMSLIVWITCYWMTADAFEENLRQKAAVLMRNISALIADAFSMGDLSHIQKVFETAQNADRDVRYIFLVATDGQLLSSTDAGRRWSSMSTRSKEVIKTTDAYAIKPSEQREISEVLFPVSSSSAKAVLVAGISQHGGNALLQAFQVRITFEFLAAFLVFWWLTKRQSMAIRQLHGMSEVIANTARQILSSVTVSMAATRSTVTVVKDSLSIVEQMKDGMDLSREKAQSLLNSAHCAADVSGAGLAAAEQVLEAFQRINAQVGQIATTMHHLNNKSRDIAGIISTVDDIARQSKMLAVNAAIEAAKAGQYGDGFAVVAKEVGDMATESKGATSRVRMFLAEIREGAEIGVRTCQLSEEVIESTVRESTGTTDSISKLTSSISESATAISEIVANAELQVTGVQTMTHAMLDIRDAVGQIVDRIEGLERAADDLSKLSVELRELTKRF